jgi:hypothetical protein
MTPDQLPILTRRRIEAEILKPVYQALVAEIGEERARAILSRAIAEAAQAAGRSWREREEGVVDLLSFAALLPLWQKEDALSITFLERSVTRLAFDVTRCRYAEMYDELGMRHIGDILSCGRDGAFCRGYAPEAEFTRTQTIMQGATHCDFRYAMPAGHRSDTPPRKDES